MQFKILLHPRAQDRQNRKSKMDINAKKEIKNLKLFFIASFIPFKKIPKVNKYIIKNTNSQVAGFVSGLCNLYFTISRRPPRIHWMSTFSFIYIYIYERKYIYYTLKVLNYTYNCKAFGIDIFKYMWIHRCFCQLTHQGDDCDGEERSPKNNSAVVGAVGVTSQM